MCFVLTSVHVSFSRLITSVGEVTVVFPTIDYSFSCCFWPNGFYLSLGDWENAVLFFSGTLLAVHITISY